ncbi:hypothetical protein AB0D37_06720 [Streptomyces sp. NPDC048384]|uniref:hypothetical protein n=1 Tax=Streptomyces sp. NPDC048384 TaxID=3155487 RepID=UPI00343E0A5A
MTKPGTELPQLKTPEGGAMSQPNSPAQWHGRPYVWAFHATGGSLGSEYIESVCKQADAEGAPPDAVYKTRSDDKSMPDEWITVGLLTNADQQARTRKYAEALLNWQAALKQHRQPPNVQPLQEAWPSGGAGRPELFEYSVAFVARISGTVRAASFAEAMSKLAPAEHINADGYVVGRAVSREGVEWRLHYDPARADMVSTSDPAMHRPADQPAQVTPVPATGVVVRRQPAKAPPQ